MTQYIEPNAHSDLVASADSGNHGVLAWLQSLRSGLIEGFEVTPGSSGLLINIASGRVIIGGTTIHDDLTRIDSTLISTSGATGNRHFLVYASYTYADPTPAMTLAVAVTSAVAPARPASPSLPADSVKLADVFIAEGETTLANAQIINAPKMPDRGQNDGDVLIERLIASDLNVIFAGGGGMAYDSVADEFSWTQDINFYAATTTHKEKYLSAPLAVGVVSVTSPPIPEVLSGVGANALIFTVFDRTVVTDPASPVPLTLRVLDLVAPDPTTRDIFFDPANCENIVWLAMVIGDVLHLRPGVGSILPPPDADGDKFLRNDPGGVHYWDRVYADLVTAVLAIDGFAVITTNPVELGDSVTPHFSAHTIDDGGNGPTTALMTNSQGAGSQNVVTSFGGTSTAANITAIADAPFARSTPGVVQETVFTLTADDGHTPDTAQATLKWGRYLYFGFEVTDPGAGAYLNPWLKGTLQGDGQQVLHVDGDTLVMNETNSSVVNSKYFFFAFPAWWGTVSQIIDNNTGFIVTSAFSEVDAAQVGITTSASIIPEDYRVWRSLVQQSPLANVNITVTLA